MPTIKQQFEKFHKEHPSVYMDFVSFAHNLQRADMKRVRADEVMHRVRWEFFIHGNTDFAIDELKVLYSNYYAMKLIEDDRSYDGFFDLTITHGG